MEPRKVIHEAQQRLIAKLDNIRGGDFNTDRSNYVFDTKSMPQHLQSFEETGSYKELSYLIQNLTRFNFIFR